MTFFLGGGGGGVKETWELSGVTHVDLAEGSVWESDGQIGPK